MENLVYLILLLTLGNLSRRLPAFPDNTSNVLNQFVIYISLPATILFKVNGLDIQAQLLMLAAIPWILVGFAVVSVRMIGRRLNWERPLIGAVMLCVALGNTSFFGFPAISIFLGTEYLGYAVIYDQLGSFLAVATFGTLIVALYGQSDRVSFKSVAYRIISFPPLIAMMLGLALTNMTYPSFVVLILEGVSATLIPVVTFSVGSALVFRQPAANMIPIGITLFLKMVACPVIAFALLKMIKISGPVFKVSVFEAGMPSMVTAGIIAAAGNLRSDVANAAIGYGILFSFLTLPFIRMFL